MKRSTIRPAVLCLLILAATTLVVAQRPADDPAAAVGVLKKSEATWDAARMDTFGGTARCRLFRYYDEEARHISRDRALDLVRRFSESASRQSLDALLDREDTGKWRKSDSNLWDVPLTIAQVGPKVRNDIKARTGWQSRIFDGVTEVSYEAVNQQADIQLGRQPFEKIRLADLRLVPDARAVRTLLEQARRGECQADDLGSGWWRVRGQGLEIEFAAKNGFVRRHLRSVPQGQPATEILQVPRPDLDPLAGFPAAVFSIRYSEGSVSMLTAFLVEDVDTKAPPDPNAFLLAVPPGTKIFDYRANRRKPAFRMAEDPVSDVLRFMSID